MNCKLCKKPSSYIFSKLILGKYQIKYYKCDNCEFLQTEDPYWLNESYQHIFSASDTGLLSRPTEYSKFTKNIINNYFNPSGKFLDYGGGIGIFTRLMRDIGYNFFSYDKYVENIVASGFTSLMDTNVKFELVTAFEVFEHFYNPVEELEKIFFITNNILFSTSLQPNENISDWWYLSEFHGQHISFYSKKTLKYLANKFDKKIYSYNKDLHLISNININQIMWEDVNESKRVTRFINIIIKNLERIKKKLNNNNQPLTSSDSTYLRDKIKRNGF